MKPLLATVSSKASCEWARPQAEPTGRRSITFSPSRGTVVVLRERRRASRSADDSERLAATA